MTLLLLHCALRAHFRCKRGLTLGVNALKILFHITLRYMPAQFMTSDTIMDYRAENGITHGRALGTFRRQLLKKQDNQVENFCQFCFNIPFLLVYKTSNTNFRRLIKKHTTTTTTTKHTRQITIKTA